MRLTTQEWDKLREFTSTEYYPIVKNILDRFVAEGCSVNDDDENQSNEDLGATLKASLRMKKALKGFWESCAKTVTPVQPKRPVNYR